MQDLTQTYSVVGGVVQPYRGRRYLARYSLTWPFARLELRPSEVRIRPRGLLQRVFPTLVIPRDQIIRVERVARVSKAIADGVRFRSANEQIDGIVFSALQPNARRLQNQLRTIGIDIQ